MTPQREPYFATAIPPRGFAAISVQFPTKPALRRLVFGRQRRHIDHLPHKLDDDQARKSAIVRSAEECRHPGSLPMISRRRFLAAAAGITLSEFGRSSLPRLEAAV